MKASALPLLFLAPLLAAASAPQPPKGNPAEGRAAFAKLRCNTCHSVYGEKQATKTRAPYPLRNLSRESADTVANLISEKTEVAPEALFDEQVMSVSANRMTQRELIDLVAYLRQKR